MSSFKVSTDGFKKAIQLAKLLIPKGNSILFEITDGGCVVIKCGAVGIWLEQTLKATEVDASNASLFAIPLEMLQKFKYPGKDVHFDLKPGTKKASAKIQISSGRAKNTTICVPSQQVKMFEQSPVKVSHSFKRETFAQGLKFLSFKPVTTTFKSKIVKVLVKNKKLYLISHDDFRGGYYCTDTDAEDLDAVIDFSLIMATLPLFSEEFIAIGISPKQIRVQCGDTDLRCLPQQGSVVSDVISHMSAQKQTKVLCSFDVDAKELKSAIISTSGVQSAEEEIRVYMELQPGKAIKKKPEDKDTIKVFTRGATALSSYLLPIDNAEGDGKFSMSFNLIKPLLVMDGFIRLSFHEHVLLMESLQYQLEYMMPQLAGGKD